MKAYDEWEDEIVVIPIAKELSGTYQSAVLAKEMSERENIEVLDSKQVTLSLRLLVEEAIRLRDEGKTRKKSKRARCFERKNSSFSDRRHVRIFV